MKPVTKNKHAEDESEDLTSDDEWTEMAEEEPSDPDMDADDDDDDDDEASAVESDGSTASPELESDTDDVPCPICSFEQFAVKTAKVARPKNRHPETYTLLKSTGDIRIYEPDGSTNTETELPGFAKFGRHKEVYYGRVVATGTIPEVLKHGKYVFHMLTPAQDWARVRKTIRRQKIGGKAVVLNDELKRLLLSASGVNPNGTAVSALSEGKYKVLMEANGGGLSMPPLSHNTFMADNKKRKGEPEPTKSAAEEPTPKKTKPAPNMFAAQPFTPKPKPPQPTTKPKPKPAEKPKPPEPPKEAPPAKKPVEPKPMVKVTMEFMVPHDTAMSWANQTSSLP